MENLLRPQDEGLKAFWGSKGYSLINNLKNIPEQKETSSAHRSLVVDFQATNLFF